ncbi:MAG: phage head closure protein [Oscillospiraceae bacterium]|nr:phage head closure protein [Oscillospiraceae bacterium]
MNVALLNVRVTIQKHTVTVDAVGNHTNGWEDYYTCRATVSGENTSSKGGEAAEAGTIADHGGADFTVRWCGKLNALTTEGFRVLFGGEAYNIIGLDHMSYKRKAVKLRCRKERR